MNMRPINMRQTKPEPANGRVESFVEQLRQYWRRNVMWILLAGLGLLVLQDVFGMHGVLAMRRAQHEAIREQVEIDRINQQNVELQGRVNSLKTDPEAVERIAREQMGLARPGEYIFKIPPKNRSSSGSVVPDPSKDQSKDQPNGPAK
ncbi:MAG: FtsB family cell division protein [Candidatus Acidiferrales bacterium]